MKTKKRVLEMFRRLKRLVRLRKASLVPAMLCLVLLSVGCKKNQDALSTQADQRQTVSDWYRSFATTASEKDKQSAEAFIKQLDYSQSTQIDRENQPSLVLVKISGDRNAFLGISKSGDALAFDGIYLSKDLAKIQQVITTRTLPANNSVLVYNLDKKPVRGWNADASGNMLQNLASAGRGSSSVTKVSTSSVRMSSWDDCQMVYWITWEISTGKLLSATYLYNTCDNAPTINFIDPGFNPGTQGVGGEMGPGEVDEYNEGLRLFTEEVNGSSAQDHEEDASFNTSAVPGDLLTKNWSADWICLNGNSSWKLRSYEVGLLRSCSLPGHPWAFKSINHQGISFEGSAPTAVDISFSQGYGYPSFTEANAAIYNYLSALMQVKFTVTYKYVNMGNRLAQMVGAFITPPETRSYESRGAWKLS